MPEKIKKNNSQVQEISFLQKILNKRFSLFIYMLCFLLQCCLLYQGCKFQLFAIPLEGMDQRTFLDAAASLYYGHIPQHLMLSPLYTVFVAALIFPSCGEIIIMRILQASLCAFIPVMIYKLSLKLGLEKIFCQISALIHCFYAAAMLISVDFLREAPLSLCYISMIYLLIVAFSKKKLSLYFFSGAMAALCILGRENFIPIAIAPVFTLIFPGIRKNVSCKQTAVYFLGILILLSPFITYNYIHYQSFEVIPGNSANISEFYFKTNINSHNFLKVVFYSATKIPEQLGKFVSSYEIPNSLSVYAHSDVIDILKIQIVPFNLLTILSILGFALYSKKNLPLVFVFFAGVAYLSTMLFFEMFYRFRIPVEPLLCVLSGAGISGFYHLSLRYKILLSFGLVLLFYLTWQNPEKLRPEAEKIAVANVFLQNGYPLKAN